MNADPAADPVVQPYMGWMFKSPTRDEARFEIRVMPEPMSGCWLWVGPINADGYGVFSLTRNRRKTTRGAHRFAYQQLRGPIAAGLQIDHLCRNRACCNPDHLEAVTPRVNTLRSEAIQAKNAKKTHCLRGHPLNGDNLKVKDGRRICRTCAAAYHRKWMRENYVPRRPDGRIAANKRRSKSLARGREESEP